MPLTVDVQISGHCVQRVNYFSISPLSIISPIATTEVVVSGLMATNSDDFVGETAFPAYDVVLRIHAGNGSSVAHSSGYGRKIHE